MRKLLLLGDAIKQFRETGLLGTINYLKQKSISAYRTKGLYLDDIANTGSQIVDEAVSRLPPHVQQERLFRLRRAINNTVTHKELPIHEHTTPSQDVRYLKPLFDLVEAEINTKQIFDTLESPPEALLKRNRLPKYQNMP